MGVRIWARSAITGRFIRFGTARLHPKTSIVEVTDVVPFESDEQLIADFQEAAKTLLAHSFTKDKIQGWLNDVTSGYQA